MTKPKLDKAQEKRLKEVTNLLRKNFDKFYLEGKELYGKGEMQMQCGVIAGLIVFGEEMRLKEELNTQKKEIKEMLESKGVETPSGKLTPQQIEFTVKAIKSLK